MRLAWAALMAISAVGCQSNSERDLIAREQRRQEDQLWAMQDYIQQYQQLVCQFRSENAALRRQLNDGSSGAGIGRSGAALQPIPNRSSTVDDVPTFQDSPAPRQGPPPAVDMPDVPPLGQGASNQLRSGHRIRGGVQQASFENPASAASNAALRGSALPDAAVSPDVLLSGEVVVNESGGGPRMVVDIESFDQSGRGTRFDGNISLALLTSEDGSQRRLARWDFGPNEVQAAAEPTSGESIIRFQVELPAGTTLDGPTEIWAKLAPTNGPAVFSHAKVNLTRPGVFSSRTDKMWASEGSVVAASYTDLPAAPMELEVDSEPETVSALNESEWSTAEPGKPATLPAGSEQSSSGWRAASEPIPTTVPEPAEAPRQLRPLRPELPKPIEPARIAAPPAKVAVKPAWSPERAGAPPRSTRPAWSATR